MTQRPMVPSQIALRQPGTLRSGCMSLAIAVVLPEEDELTFVDCSKSLTSNGSYDGIRSIEHTDNVAGEETYRQHQLPRHVNRQSSVVSCQLSTWKKCHHSPRCSPTAGGCGDA